MEEASVRNCRKLLHSFIVSNYEDGNMVHSQVTGKLLNEYLVLDNQSVNEVFDKPSFELFLDQFEQYIMTQSKILGIVKPNMRKTVRQNHPNEKLVKIQKLAMDSRKEANNVLTSLKKCFDLTNNLERNLNEMVNANCVAVELLIAKKKLVRAKSMSCLLNETPLTRKAMEKLKNIVETENREVEDRLNVLEEQEKKYREIDNCAEFQALLANYKKLLLRKETLLLEREEALS